jgi:hypothetical protein
LAVAGILDFDPVARQPLQVLNDGGGSESKLVSVDVRTQSGFTFGKPAPIPIPGARLGRNGRNGRNYDITPDGKHFIRDRAGIHGKCRSPAVPRNKSTLF